MHDLAAEQRTKPRRYCKRSSVRELMKSKTKRLGRQASSANLGASLIMHKRKYRNKTWLPFAMIETAVREEWDLSLCYLVKLKGIHQNNTFYNFSYRSLAKTIGVSHSAMARHIKILSQKGIVRIQNGNLTIVSAKKLATKYETFLVAISKEKKFSNKISNVRTAIRFAIINRNLHKQKIVSEEKAEVIKISEGKTLSKDELKQYKKSMKKFNFEPEKRFEKDTVMSLRKFGKLIGRSQETGKRLKKVLIEQKLITSQKRTDLVSTRKYSRSSFFMLELPTGYFLSRAGYIYLNRPCKVMSCIGRTNTVVGQKKYTEEQPKVA